MNKDGEVILGVKVGWGKYLDTLYRVPGRLRISCKNGKAES